MRWAAILQATRKEKHLKSSKTEEAQEQHAEEEEAPLFADPPKLSLDENLCSQPVAAEHAFATTGEQREFRPPPASSQNSIQLKPNGTNGGLSRLRGFLLTLVAFACCFRNLSFSLMCFWLNVTIALNASTCYRAMTLLNCQ